LSLDQAKASPDSSYNVLREMLKIRKAFPALQRGAFRRILIEGNSYVFERKTEAETLLIAANFSTEEQYLKLPAKVEQDLTPQALKRSCTLKNEQLVLPGCGYFIGKI
jgi:glycosidase